MPGAYFKTIVTGTTKVELIIDGVANEGCPANSMPFVEYSIDEAPFVVKQLTETGKAYPLELASGLDVAAQHRIEFYFRAADLGQNRWTQSTAHLRLSGLQLDEGGAALVYPKRSKLAMGFGDSITEGVGVDGLFTSWQLLVLNNARGSWFPFVCAALDCEYGQFGSGGQGMVKVLAMPELPKTWDHYDSGTSRLNEKGLLTPEPDYIFCCMGTNDYGGINIFDAYVGWLADARKACPNAHIFCVIPPSGVHRDEIKAVVKARRDANDKAVHIIDTPGLNNVITARASATQLTYDGVHPSIQGEGLFGACIAVQAQQALTMDMAGPH
jgi:lysophospholipase L1-like esterase